MTPHGTSRPVAPKPDSPTAISAPLPAQEWIEEEVRKCHTDQEQGLWNVRQARSPANIRILLRRWQHLNLVIGAPTSDTWLIAALIGVGVAVAVMVALGAASYSRLSLSGFFVGGAVGIPLGLVVGYSRFVTMVFRETYIEVIVDEYRSAVRASREAVDVVVAFLPRLGYILRPDVFEGNRGETGFRDKGARIRLRTNFGQSMHDLRQASDFYDLPANENCLAQAANMERYSIETLVRSAGTLYRLYGVPRPAEDAMSKLSGAWHWILLVVAMGVSIFIVVE